MPRTDEAFDVIVVGAGNAALTAALAARAEGTRTDCNQPWATGP